MVVARFEFFAYWGIPDRLGERVFGYGEGDARAGAADGGDAAGFILLAVAEADLGGRGGGEGMAMGLR